MRSLRYYKKEGDSYQFIYEHDGISDVRFRTKQIAFGYQVDPDVWIMHKHGEPEKVRQWLLETQSKLREQGHREMAAEFMMATIVPPFPVEEINKVLDISGYIQEFLRRAETGEFEA